jgi:hypothetical protein
MEERLPEPIPPEEADRVPPIPERSRKITARLVRRGTAESEFEREFWNRLTPEERVECLWDMVLEARELNGLHGDEPGLQKSVVRLVRRDG